MDREAFISRVGEAMASSRLPAPDAAVSLPQPSDIDLVGLFSQRALSVSAVVHGPMALTEVAAAVEGIAADHGGQTFLAWDELPAPGVVSGLIAAGLRRLPHEVREDDRLDAQLPYLELDFGITGADAGLAESGSLVLAHGPGRPRMASLIPEIHIALLPTGEIHRSLAHLAQLRPAMGGSTTNLVVVTGPSRTGDIELQLNLGVHGPRIVHIVLIRT